MAEGPFYVADWFDDSLENVEDYLVNSATFAFARAEQYHGVKLGPFRRDHEEEARMLEECEPPRPHLSSIRVYVADVVVN